MSINLEDYNDEYENHRITIFTNVLDLALFLKEMDNEQIDDIFVTYPEKEFVVHWWIKK